MLARSDARSTSPEPGTLGSHGEDRWEEFTGEVLFAQTFERRRRGHVRSTALHLYQAFGKGVLNKKLTSVNKELIFQMGKDSGRRDITAIPT